MVVMYFAAFGCVAGALFGIPTAHLFRLMRMQWRRGLYLAAVAASIVPYALHYQQSLQYLARSGVENYPGLDRFMVSVPAVASIVVVVALLIAWVRPAVAALTPVMFGVVYWLLLIPILYRDTPARFVGLDNVPFIWLFGFSVAGCVFLFVLSVFALRDRSNSGVSGMKAEQTVAADRHEDAAPAER